MNYELFIASLLAHTFKVYGRNEYRILDLSREVVNALSTDVIEIEIHRNIWAGTKLTHMYRTKDRSYILDSYGYVYVIIHKYTKNLSRSAFQLPVYIIEPAMCKKHHRMTLLDDFVFCEWCKIVE